jgi:hypothetical protein
MHGEASRVKGVHPRCATLRTSCLRIRTRTTFPNTQNRLNTSLVVHASGGTPYTMRTSPRFVLREPPPPPLPPTGLRLRLRRRGGILSRSLRPRSRSLAQARGRRSHNHGHESPGLGGGGGGSSEGGCRTRGSPSPRLPSQQELRREGGSERESCVEGIPDFEQHHKAAAGCPYTTVRFPWFCGQYDHKTTARRGRSTEGNIAHAHAPVLPAPPPPSQWMPHPMKEGRPRPTRIHSHTEAAQATKEQGAWWEHGNNNGNRSRGWGKWKEVDEEERGREGERERGREGEREGERESSGPAGPQPRWLPVTVPVPVSVPLTVPVPRVPLTVIQNARRGAVPARHGTPRPVVPRVPVAVIVGAAASVPGVPVPIPAPANAPTTVVPTARGRQVPRATIGAGGRAAATAAIVRVGCRGVPRVHI